MHTGMVASIMTLVKYPIDGWELDHMLKPRDGNANLKVKRLGFMSYD